jgi:hypothetical protein
MLSPLPTPVSIFSQSIFIRDFVRRVYCESNFFFHEVNTPRFLYTMLALRYVTYIRNMNMVEALTWTEF